MAEVRNYKSAPNAVRGHSGQRLVFRFQPFRALTTEMVLDAVSRLRFPDDPVRGRKVVSSGAPLSLSGREILLLMRLDQLHATLDKLDRMQEHYREVSKLNAEEVQRRLAEVGPEDPGVLAYKWCLVEGADPRLEIARRLLTLIPIARRHLEEGKQALDLDEIFTLNEQANGLLMAPHAHRGLNNLVAAREGGRRRNPEGRDERESLALLFLEEKRADPQLTQRQFIANHAPSATARTLRRGLKDLKSLAGSGEPQ